MKKLIFLFVVIFVEFGVYAQDQASQNLSRTCVLKYMPVNSALQSYSFEIEGMVSSNSAITFGFGIPHKGSLIGKYGIEASPNNLTSADLTTFHIRAAYRHYAGRSKLPRGFYIEPYLKYQEVKGNATANINDNGTRFPATFETYFNSVNAGFQTGVQFMIAKKIVIDFYFLGIEAGLLNGNLSGMPRDLRYYQNLSSKMDGWVSNLPSFLRDDLIVTHNLNSYYRDVNVSAHNLVYPWFRGGISIGLAF
jgi:hypothetical protein